MVTSWPKAGTIYALMFPEQEYSLRLDLLFDLRELTLKQKRLFETLC